MRSNSCFLFGFGTNPIAVKRNHITYDSLWCRYARARKMSEEGDRHTYSVSGAVIILRFAFHLIRFRITLVLAKPHAQFTITCLIARIHHPFPETDIILHVSLNIFRITSRLLLPPLRPLIVYALVIVINRLADCLMSHNEIRTMHTHNTWNGSNGLPPSPVTITFRSNANQIHFLFFPIYSNSVLAETFAFE